MTAVAKERRESVHLGRSARWFLTAQVLSGFADNAVWLACCVWIVSLTGEAGTAGILLFLVVLPQLAAGHAGAAVDRMSGRAVCLAANGVGVAGSLLLLIVGMQTVWVLYAAMFVFGLSNTGSTVGQSALMAELLSGDQTIDRANGVLRGVSETLRLLSPGVGVAVFRLAGGPGLAAIDITSFAVATAIIATLPRCRRFSEPHSKAARRANRPRAVGNASGRAPRWVGVRFIARSPAHRAIVGAALALTIVLGVSESTIYLVATVVLHHSASFVAVLSTCTGVGGLIGGVLAAGPLRPLPYPLRMLLASAGFGVSALLQAVTSLAIAVVGFTLFGFALTVMMASMYAFMQSRTPFALLGRVQGTATAGLGVAQLSALVAGSWLAAHMPTRAILVALATLAAATVVGLAIASCRSDIRNVGI